MENLDRNNEKIEKMINNLGKKYPIGIMVKYKDDNDVTHHEKISSKPLMLEGFVYIRLENINDKVPLDRIKIVK